MEDWSPVTKVKGKDGRARTEVVCPDLWSVQEVKDWLLNKRGDQSRPGFFGLKPLLRLKLAWGVFRGRYDALDWSDM